MVLYKVAESDFAKISSLLKLFRLKHALPDNFEFHHYSNSKYINNLFTDFIKHKLVEKNLIVEVFYVQIDFESEPISHILAFKKLLLDISKSYSNLEVKIVFDKLGGGEAESIIRTAVGRLCRENRIKLKKPLAFVDSKKSDFIQIADYLVAIVDKGL